MIMLIHVILREQSITDETRWSVAPFRLTIPSAVSPSRTSAQLYTVDGGVVGSSLRGFSSSKRSGANRMVVAALYRPDAHSSQRSSVAAQRGGVRSGADRRARIRWDRNKTAHGDAHARAIEDAPLTGGAGPLHSRPRGPMSTIDARARRRSVSGSAVDRRLGHGARLHLHEHRGRSRRLGRSRSHLRHARRHTQRSRIDGHLGCAVQADDPEGGVAAEADVVAFSAAAKRRQ